MINQRKEWLEKRRSYITSSDAAAILNLSRYKSALEVYADKVLDAAAEDEPEYVKIGKLQEPVIAKLYSNATDRALLYKGDYDLVSSKEYPFMAATPDRYWVKTEAQWEWNSFVGVIGIVELKNVVGFKRDDWLEEPPLMFQVQLQHQLIVCGLKKGSFGVLFNGNSFGWVDQDLNGRFADYLIEQEKAFWQRVQERRPPEPDASVSAKEAIARLYPKEHEAEAIALDSTYLDLATHLDNAKKLKKENKHAILEIENQIKAAMGDAAVALLPDGSSFTLKTVQRVGYSVEATSYRQLRKESKRMAATMNTATYSPEDNKLRLYPASRLDAETYAKVKAAGFARTRPKAC